MIKSALLLIKIFIDLFKAFDKVIINHQISLDKLYHYGIHDIPFNWISSYLSNRQQYAQYDRVNSSAFA